MCKRRTRLDRENKIDGHLFQQKEILHHKANNAAATPPKAAIAPAATLPPPLVVTIDVVELVAELVAEPVVEDRTVLSVVLLAPVAVAEVGTAVAVVESPVAELLLSTVEVLDGLETPEAEDPELGLLIVVAAVVETLVSEELELVLLLDVVELPESELPESERPEDLIWNGNEYWKVVGSESRLILIP